MRLATLFLCVMAGASEDSLTWDSRAAVPNPKWSIRITASGQGGFHFSTDSHSFDRDDVGQWKQKTLARLCELFDEKPGKVLVEITKVSVSWKPLSDSDTGGWAVGYEINHVSTETKHIERFTIHRREHLEEVIMHAGGFEGTWEK